MSKPIRVAVIGCGKLGSRHAHVYSKIHGVELVGVCDIIEHRAKEVAHECKSKAYQDYRDLLKNTDAASIVVPSGIHYAIAKEFLENQVNLLIEKPITTTLKDADHLLILAEQDNLVLQVGHIERYNSAIRAIKDVIKKPRFIE